MKEQIRVLLVDDHTLLIETLSDRLSKEEDLEIVGTCPNAEEGLKLARNLKPDVIIFDIDMPGLICFDAAKQIKNIV